MHEPLEDDFIEIPESAGLSDVTREAIFNVWAHEDLYEDSGFDEGVHYTRVGCPLSSLLFILYLLLIRVLGLPGNAIQAKKRKTQSNDPLPRNTTPRKGLKKPQLKLIG